MDKNTDSVSAFDLLYTTNHIQMLKASLPYLPASIQPMLVVLIKYMELIYAISCLKKPLCGLPPASNGSIAELIASVQNYLTESEKKQFHEIESIMKNFEQMKEMQKIMDLVQTTSTDNKTVDNLINEIFSDDV